MTSIELTVTGAAAQARVDGVLTDGMVGLPVTIRYDSDWDGLTKMLVCKAGGSRPDSAGVVKAILNVGNEATVAPEVMIAKKFLYLGVEGRNADGTLVIPTVWASCGRIQASADVEDDASADYTLPIWAQLQRQIDTLTQNGVTDAQIAEAVAAYLKENPAEVALSDSLIGNEAELETALEAVYSQMAALETKLVRWQGYPSNSDYRWFGFLFKSSASYGSLLAHSAYDKGLITKTKQIGSWKPVKWETAYPIVPTTNKFGNYGGTDVGICTYYAKLTATEYADDVFDIEMYGKMTLDSQNNSRYGIDVSAMISAVNSLFGKSYTDFYNDWCAPFAEFRRADTGVVLASREGYCFSFSKNTAGTKAYLTPSRIYSTDAIGGPWSQDLMYSSSGDGNMILHAKFRMKLY